jgi:hypothetical protein
MKRIAFAVIAASFASHTASAGAAWSTISITTTPSNAAQVVAATDKLMNSEVGKAFPGRLLDDDERLAAVGILQYKADEITLQRSLSHEIRGDVEFVELERRAGDRLRA